MAKEPQVIEGVIGQVNDDGYKVESLWFNWSTLDHMASTNATLKALNARKGQRVRITYEPGKRPGGFITDLQLLGDGPAPAGPAAAGNGHGGGYARSAEERLSIERQTCLKAAVEFLTPRTDAKSKDVLPVADLFERWLHRAVEAPAEPAAAGVR